jgi:dolichyl-phosphate beta-glucosyltransferase
MSEVLKVLKALQEGSSIAIASRSCPDSRFIFAPENFQYLYTRHIASKSLNFIIGRMFLPQFKDTQAGLKGFTAASAEFIFSQLHLSGFSFDLEILHLAHQAGLSVREVPIHFYAQRVSTINFPLEVLRMVRDIARIYYWTIRHRYNFSPSLPLVDETVNASAANRAGKI